MIGLDFNHTVSISELGKWIDTTISFSVGNLAYMYPRPIEIFIKWTIFIGIIAIIGSFIFAPLVVISTGFEKLFPDIKMFCSMTQIFAGGCLMCIVSYWILFLFNFINGAAVG